MTTEGPLYSAVLDLYNRSLDLGTPAEPLPFPPGDPTELWREFWRDLGFHTDAPTGSSYLVHLAMLQSTTSTGPADAVLALWEVVATCSANSAFDSYFRELSGASRDARYGQMRAALAGLAPQGTAQVLLQGYLSDADVERVQEVYDQVNVDRRRR